MTNNDCGCYNLHFSLRAVHIQFTFQFTCSVHSVLWFIFQFTCNVQDCICDIYNNVYYSVPSSLTKVYNVWHASWTTLCTMMYTQVYIVVYMVYMPQFGPVFMRKVAYKRFGRRWVTKVFTAGSGALVYVVCALESAAYMRPVICCFAITLLSG